MPAPILQFKRGLLANLPGLRAGEPGFTTDSYELYVGIDSTTNNNKFFGSHRYWTKGTASTGSGVNFVEGTSNGTDYITIKASNTLAGIVTFTLPLTDGDPGDVLKTNGSGSLSFSTIEDKITIVSGNSVNIVYNASAGGGNVAICTNPSGPITLNVTGIPTDSYFDNRLISFSVIVNQGTTAYGCTNVSLNGVAFGANATAGVQTHIAYLFGIVATGSTTGFDIFNFTGINTTGSASTTTNYKLLSSVSNYSNY
jgi:hypothetical protein